MPINAPIEKPTQGRVLRWGFEDVAWGTKATVIHQEPVTDCTEDAQRDFYNAAEVTGMMTGEIGSNELTHYMQGTITGPFRMDGVTCQSLANMMAAPAASYTPVGVSAPYTHTLHLNPFSNVCNSLSLWWQSTVDPDGTATRYTKCYTGCRTTSVALTFGPGGALDTTVSWWGQWAQDDLGTPTDFIGANAATRALTRTLGYQGTFTLYGSTGVVYCPRVLSGTVTFSREAEAVYAADNQTIVDVALGPLTLTGSVVLQFDGYATGSNGGATLAKDFYNYSPTGSSTAKNSMKWTDSDGHYMQLSSYKWLWHPFNLDYSGQFVKANGTFTARPDPLAFQTATTPVLTHLDPLVLVNDIGTAMIQPITQIGM